MRTKWILALTILLSTVIRAVGQDVQFTGSVRPTVAVGETFTLNYTVNGQAGNFKGPAMKGLEMLSGPNTSTSSSISMVNGRTTMTISYTFTYLLQATREGTFDIPPASVVVNGKQYSSNALSVKVVKNPNVPSGQVQGGTQGKQGGGGISSTDVYVKAFASNANPLQGEAIIVTYKIFTKVPVAQININKLSSFSGFWSQNLMKENDKLQQTQQVIDGEQYVVADIRKIALFPLKSGKLVIDPLELNCVAQVRRQNRTRTGDPFFDDFFNDSFFNTGVTNVEKDLKSNPLVINVRPLPEQGKPAGFSGAVGNFTFQAEVDRTRLKTNEAVTLKFKVSGKGNIQLIDKMDVTFPPDFESYDPKVTSDIQTTAAGVSGSQVFEYLLIPRKPGKFTLKPVTFSYFDLTRQQYVTLTSPEFNLEVEKGTGEPTTAVTYSGASKEEIKYIGSDIRHINEKLVNLRIAGTRFFPSALFWIVLLLPVVLFGAFVILFRKFAARRSDTVLMKNRRATKIARKRLKSAEGFLKAGKQEEFYVAISQSLWGYISDKFGIPLSELSIGSVSDALRGKGVGEPIIGQFTDTLNHTEFARFAPGEKSINMERIYNEALEIITRIERELR